MLLRCKFGVKVTHCFSFAFRYVAVLITVPVTVLQCCHFDYRCVAIFVCWLSQFWTVAILTFAIMTIFSNTNRKWQRFAQQPGRRLVFIHAVFISIPRDG